MWKILPAHCCLSVGENDSTATLCAEMRDAWFWWCFKLGNVDAVVGKGGTGGGLMSGGTFPGRSL